MRRQGRGQRRCRGARADAGSSSGFRLNCADRSWVGISVAAYPARPPHPAGVVRPPAIWFGRGYGPLSPRLNLRNVWSGLGRPGRRVFAAPAVEEAAEAGFFLGAEREGGSGCTPPPPEYHGQGG